MREILVSIIIPCKNEGENIRHTINSIKENSGAISYEIIVVDDASDDGCCDFLREQKVAGVILVNTAGVHANRARNIGAENARGDIYIFCDAHIFVAKGWLEKLAETLAVPGIDAVSPGIKPHDYAGPDSWGGLTWKANMEMAWLPVSGNIYPVPVLTAGCLAIKRTVFDAVGGFEKGFRVYGFEDVEFTLKLWLFGFGAYINPDVTYLHIFRNAHSYLISGADIHYNLLRLAFLHFNQSRLSKIIAQIKNNPYFPDIFTDMVLSDAPKLRKEYFDRRVYDDDWFVQKFNIPF